MKKFFYYLRLITFILYFIVMFLLIEDFYKPDIIRFIFYTASIFYSIVMILSILSKKEIFKDLISFNLVNIGLYTYLFIIYFVVFKSPRIEILSNEIYFRNNLILLGFFSIVLAIFTLSINKDENE